MERRRLVAKWLSKAGSLKPLLVSFMQTKRQPENV